MSAFDDTGPLGNAEDLPLSGMGTTRSPLPVNMPGTLSPIEGDGMFPPVGGNRGLAGGPQLASAGVSDAPMQLKAAFFDQESGNNPNAATSVDNAQGRAQMTPETFAKYARPGEDIHRDSATVGGRALSDYWQKFGHDPARVAVAYFSGPGNVAPPGSPTPWVHDHHDGNFKYVSQYVADITRRLKGGSGVLGPASASTDQTAPLAAAQPPNLSPEEYQKTHNQSIGKGLEPLLIAGTIAIGFLGVALGRKGDVGSMGAVAGLSGFVNGLAEGQEAKARQGLADYKAWVDVAQKTYENNRQKTNDILANEKLSIDTKLEQLKVHAAETQDQKLYELAVKKNLAEIDDLHARTENHLASAKTLADRGTAALGKFKFLTDDAINDLAEEALEKPEVLKGLGVASKTAVENRMAELKREKAAKAPTRKPDERGFFSRHLPTFLGGEPDPNAPAPAPRSGGGPPTASALPPGYTQEKALDEARQAIAKGAPREGVAARLKTWGIDPAILESGSNGSL